MFKLCKTRFVGFCLHNESSHERLEFRCCVFQTTTSAMHGCRDPSPLVRHCLPIRFCPRFQIGHQDRLKLVRVAGMSAELQQLFRGIFVPNPSVRWNADQIAGCAWLSSSGARPRYIPAAPPGGIGGDNGTISARWPTPAIPTGGGSHGRGRRRRAGSGGGGAMAASWSSDSIQMGSYGGQSSMNDPASSYLSMNDPHSYLSLRGSDDTLAGNHLPFSCHLGTFT